MSSKLTGSSPSYCCNHNSNGSHCPNLSGPYILGTIQTLKKTDRSCKLHLNSCSKKHRRIPSTSIWLRHEAMSVSGNTRPKASASSQGPSSSSSSPSPSSSSSSWKKWLMGIVLAVVLPAVGHKGGLIVALKGKIDQTIAMVENVTEIVEEIAEEADKLVDEVEKKLPDDSKLKETLESFDDLTKVAVKEAKKAEDLIHKVKDTEKEIVGALMNAREDHKPKQ